MSTDTAGGRRSQQGADGPGQHEARARASAGETASPVHDLRARNQAVIEQFRAGGEIPGMHRERLLLLTTVGARSGLRHTAPMMFHRDGERLLVIASNAGAPEHPAWYRNLLADPSVAVEVGDESYAATARPLEGDERERAWQQITALYPFFAEHQVKAGRTIPIVALEGAAPDAPASPD